MLSKHLAYRPIARNLTSHRSFHTTRSLSVGQSNVLAELEDRGFVAATTRYALCVISQPTVRTGDALGLAVDLTCLGV